MKGNLFNVMTTYSQESLLQLVTHFNKIKGNELSGSQVVKS